MASKKRFHQKVLESPYGPEFLADSFATLEAVLSFVYELRIRKRLSWMDFAYVEEERVRGAVRKTFWKAVLVEDRSVPPDAVVLRSKDPGGRRRFKTTFRAPPRPSPPASPEPRE